MKILKFGLIVIIMLTVYTPSFFAMTDEEVICENKSEKCQSAFKILHEGKLKDFERDANGNVIAAPRAAMATNCL